MDNTDNMEPVRVDEIQGFWSYLATIDWSEPWFMVLAIFHLLCFVITLLTRQRGRLQALHFSILLMIVYFAEAINEWAAKNYRLFARQQYFDSNGLFISVVFSTPILFNCLVIVIMWLTATGSLFVEVRQMKIRQLQRKREKQNEKNKKDENEVGEDNKKTN